MLDLTPVTKLSKAKRVAKAPGPWIFVLVAFEVIYHFALPFLTK